VEEKQNEFHWITHVFASLFMIPLCIVASIIPFALGRGYIGYALPTPAQPDGFMGLREFKWLNMHPWLKLKYVLPLVYAALVVRAGGLGPVVSYVVTSGLIIAFMAAIVLGVSFLFPSLDEKPKKVPSSE
jgi:hypothetical protein